MADYISGKVSPPFIAGGLQGSLEGTVKRNVVAAAGREPHYSKPLKLCLDARQIYYLRRISSRFNRSDAP
jgi:hypothetical protein